MEAKGSLASSSSSSSSSGRPVKGILKNPSGGAAGGLAGWGSPPSAPPPQPPPPAPPRRRPPEGTPAAALEGKKSQKWDEMNILATYHPAGKDYGLMKIDEPSTPYHRLAGDDEDAGSDTEISEVPTADVLAKKLAAAAEGQGPKILARQEESSDEEEDAELTPEELEKKKQFEMKRKMHYNEAQNIKLARKLIEKELHGEAAEDDEGDEEDDDDEEMQDVGKMSPELVPAPPSDPLENMAHSLEEACPGL
ncbi:hypothetical protein JRQ81_017551 [Phrynocephalus forsythii]|uniref:Protein phosphatase inhibitor 2 n=1 Tax=Phrynocephalus forsythii TaxID=171643 RepID=A0A9Q0XQI7_9SAUR|nr:hypothetical protein JRQ81_017551 [Phrynocephalus forsythii]